MNRPLPNYYAPLDAQESSAPRAPRPRAKRQNPEATLQQALVQHLRLRCPPTVYWFAVPNGELRSARTAARLKASGVRAGAPDLVFVIDGHAHGLELKAIFATGRKGQLSQVQKDTRKLWEASGGRYAVAVGLDAALDVLKTWGVLR